MIIIERGDTKQSFSSQYHYLNADVTFQGVNSGDWSGFSLSSACSS